ncbi:MAG: hypothetical protein FWB91_02800 [Defluviitaleaceae bacterium]|nr:hypothetical protein [Defluviitaleaceae bacterium]
MPYIFFIITAFVVAYIIQIAAIFLSPGHKMDGENMGKTSQRLLMLCMLSPSFILLVFIIIGQVPLDWNALGILPVRLGMWGLAFIVTLLYQCVLQPFLINEFGSMWGILLLGIIWGFWHLPINLAGLNDTKNP